MRKAELRSNKRSEEPATTRGSGAKRHKSAEKAAVSRRGGNVTRPERSRDYDQIKRAHRPQRKHSERPHSERPQGASELRGSDHRHSDEPVKRLVRGERRSEPIKRRARSDEQRGEIFQSKRKLVCKAQREPPNEG